MSADFTPTAKPIARLIEEFNKLPGIGPKSAQRLTYYILRAPAVEAEALADAIRTVKEKVALCSVCYNITDTDPCSICQDSERDHSVICIVEEPIDIIPLERTTKFKGLYHVLHGVLSPSDGIGPEELKTRELLARLNGGSVTEIILATNPNVEGEATAMYLQRLIAPLGLRITRLARGLPYGGDLEYADDVTIARALEGRQEM
ncbi:MAG: recombination protein RecR [Chloroflexi bacterium]|nr:recombination protein RecR [Chloroflexota bacterium]